jgi:hypothetical protein
MVTHLASKICFSGIIHLSLSSKTIKTNTQNLCLSPLMLENRLPLSGNTSAGAHVLLQGVDPGFHCVPLHHIYLKFKIRLCFGTGCCWGTTYTSC